MDGDSIAAARSLDPSSLPHPVDTFWPSYGVAHERPVLALSRHVGAFHVDLTTFKVGMPVRCKYLDKRGRSCGWFPGVINRILNDTHLADIDYDDGTYDYAVPFKRLRIRSDHTSRTFNVAHIPAPFAIVLSIHHAREAVVRALQLIEMVKAENESNQEDDCAFSTHSHSRSSTPPAVLTFDSSSYPTDDGEGGGDDKGGKRAAASDDAFAGKAGAAAPAWKKTKRNELTALLEEDIFVESASDDDDVVFVMEGVGSSRGSVSRPIML